MLQIARFLSNSSFKANSVSVALVLSGCGVFDGAEIHEASACLVHLSRHAANVGIFAPDKAQMHVINHCTGNPDSEGSRNVLVESARVARGKISPLSELKASKFDAVVFPGGFGAAKNLSTFAVDGDKMSVDDEVARVVQEFKSASKPQGFCCIAPVIAARLLPGVELTVGMSKDTSGCWPYAGTAASIEAMGATHVDKDVTEVHVDEGQCVVSTPAFMCEAPYYQVFDGIGNMITTLLRMAK